MSSCRLRLSGSGQRARGLHQCIEETDELRYALRDRAALGCDRGLVSPGHGAGQGAVRAQLRPVLDALADKRRQQGAGLYQLRAACELAGLVMRGGDRATARRVLAEACDAVKGGASIACVTQARTLLSSLAS